MIPETVGTAYTEADPSEHILFTPYYIDSVLFLLVENVVKEKCTAALGENSDVDSVLRVELNADKVSV